MAHKVDRRKFSRGDVRWPITVISDQGTIEGETRNISFDGIYIRCDQPLELNENFRMAISPPDHDAIGVTGKVIWSDFYGMDHEDTFVGMGVCLVEISDKDRESFQDVVSDHIRQ
ncbi:MAG: PilZ domain-containing protein [Desulfobacterales bacterium]